MILKGSWTNAATIVLVQHLIMLMMPPKNSGSVQRIVSKLQGSCLCGAVHWEASNLYVSQICVCHCSMCRRFSGSTHIPFAAVERSKLWPLMQDFLQTKRNSPQQEHPQKQDQQQQEQLKSYQSSPMATRYFCGTCSSAVLFDYHQEPNTLWIPMGTLLDFDSSLLDPTRDSHIFANDQAGYEARLSMSGSNDSPILPKCAGWGLYKHDPCQPTKDWNELPTTETPVRLVDERGNIVGN